MVIPAGARPIEAFISCRLNEPLRREPQIATTFAIDYPVGWFEKEQRHLVCPGRRRFPSTTAKVVAREQHYPVMAGRSPSKTGVNALLSRPSTSCFLGMIEDVDARHKAGHDELMNHDGGLC